MDMRRIVDVLTRIADLPMLESEFRMCAAYMNREFWTPNITSPRKASEYNQHTHMTSQLLVNIQHKRRSVLPAELRKEVEWAHHAVDKALLDAMETERIRLDKKYGVKT